MGFGREALGAAFRQREVGRGNWEREVQPGRCCRELEGKQEQTELEECAWEGRGQLER